MANYVQGGFNSVENSYNLLVSGAPGPNGGYATSSIYLGADTHSAMGTRLMFNNTTSDAAMDLRAADTNTMSFRYTTDGSAMNNMLALANDTSMSNDTRYAATVGGRVNASAFFVNGSLSDHRGATSQGLYMGLNATTVGQFNINKGASGVGGFQFNTYDAGGNLTFNNMNLKANGVVQAVYYNATGHAPDFETVAIAGFDHDGNLVRNYGANQRFRLAESRLKAVEDNLYNPTGPVPEKINEIIYRLNGLNFFSCTIQNLVGWNPVVTIT